MSEIKAIRQRLGLRAKDVAAELNVFPSVYSRWENSESVPRRVSFAIMHAFDRLAPNVDNHPKVEPQKDADLVNLLVATARCKEGDD